MTSWTLSSDIHNPVRQVPRDKAPRRGARQDPQGRIRPPQRQTASVHQGPEIHPPVAPAKPHRHGPQEPEVAAGRQQASEHRLPAQGILRPTLGLQPRALGTEVLRELASEPEVAALEAVREVCRDDRAALGWYRRLLPTRKQGRAGLCRGSEQQDTCHAAPCLWSAGRGIPPAEGTDLDAAADLSEK